MEKWRNHQKAMHIHENSVTQSHIPKIAESDRL